MNRIEREALICKLKTDNVATLVEMQQRRECLGDAAFEPQQVVHRSWSPPSQRAHRSSTVPSIERRVVEQMVREMHQQDVQPVTPDELRAALETVADVVGEEIGLIEKNIRADLVRRQDDAIRLINERLDSIDTALADLASRLDGIEADTIDRSVTPLKRKRDAA